jgi:hypothetical protein
MILVVIFVMLISQRLLQGISPLRSPSPYGICPLSSGKVTNFVLKVGRAIALSEFDFNDVVFLGSGFLVCPLAQLWRLS